MEPLEVLYVNGTLLYIVIAVTRIWINTRRNP